MLQRQWSKHIVLAVLLLLFGACQDNPHDHRVVPKEPLASPAGPPAAGLEGLGQQIFTGKGTCQVCHGPDASGTPLAPDLTDQEWLHLTDVTREAIAELIVVGVQQPLVHPAPMPPRGGGSLNDEEIQAVSAYVYSLSHQTEE